MFDFFFAMDSFFWILDIGCLKIIFIIFIFIIVLLTGYYCIPENVVVGVAFTTYDPCPMGFFCPNGTGHDWQSCPAGTYGAAQGLTAAEECTPCDGGKRWVEVGVQ